jgi:hypothetical protein
MIRAHVGFGHFPEIVRWYKRLAALLAWREALAAGQHAGVGGAGGHGIHADPRLRDFERHRLGEAFDGMLAADIDGTPAAPSCP